MFWRTVKDIQLKTVSGHIFSHIKFKNEEELKEKMQSSKTLHYPIINKSAKEVKWGIWN